MELTPKDLRDLEKLVRSANLVMLVFSHDKKAGLGLDMQTAIADSLQAYADMLETSDA